MLPVVMRVKISSVEVMAADALLPSRERTTNVRANCWVVFMFLSFCFNRLRAPAFLIRLLWNYQDTEERWLAVNG